MLKQLQKAFPIGGYVGATAAKDLADSKTALEYGEVLICLIRPDCNIWSLVRREGSGSIIVTFIEFDDDDAKIRTGRIVRFDSVEELIEDINFSKRAIAAEDIRWSF